MSYINQLTLNVVNHAAPTKPNARRAGTIRTDDLTTVGSPAFVLLILLLDLFEGPVDVGAAKNWGYFELMPLPGSGCSELPLLFSVTQKGVKLLQEAIDEVATELLKGDLVQRPAKEGVGEESIDLNQGQNERQLPHRPRLRLPRRLQTHAESLPEAVVVVDRVARLIVVFEDLVAPDGERASGGENSQRLSDRHATSVRRHHLEGEVGKPDGKNVHWHACDNASARVELADWLVSHKQAG